MAGTATTVMVKGYNPKTGSEGSTHWFQDGDVIIKVHDGNELEPAGLFRVHKQLLSISSEFFRNMFKDGSVWVENQDDTETTPSVVIESVNPQDFALFLDWIYPFKNRIFDLVTVQKILYLGDRFLCANLIDLCRYGCDNVPPSYELLILAIKHKFHIQTCRTLIVWAIQQRTMLFDERMLQLSYKAQAYLMRLAALWQICPSALNGQCPDCGKRFVDSIMGGYLKRYTEWYLCAYHTCKCGFAPFDKLLPVTMDKLTE